MARAVAPKRRLTAAQRREDLLAAALGEFGRTGYHGTSTETIAQRAGISQPYLFRLYGTKKELFLACVDRCFDLTIEAFRHAVADPGDAASAREAMGRAYVEMLGDRELVLFQHQTYAAAGDDEDIRALARRRFEELARVIEELGGLDAHGRRLFVGQGMLLNVIASLGFEPEEWVFLEPDT